MGVEQSLHRDARRAAEHLTERHSHIEAVCLYGSVARGDADEYSDIDLLLVGSDPDVRVSRLLEELRAEFPQRKFGLVYHHSPDLTSYFEAGSRFLVHIREEGEILYDDHGYLRRLLATELRLAPVEDEIATALDRLSVYHDVSRFNGGFLFCFAHVYTLGKMIVMARLAARDEFVFRREAAFERFAQIWPRTKPQLADVRRLRPFYVKVSRRRPEPLPFPAEGTGEELSRSVRAAELLATHS